MPMSAASGGDFSLLPLSLSRVVLLLCCGCDSQEEGRRASGSQRALPNQDSSAQGFSRGGGDAAGSKKQLNRSK